MRKRVEAPAAPVVRLVEARAVYPVPASAAEQKSSGLKPGPWMPGDDKPAREGMYLRYFDDVRDSAWSWWRNGTWHTQGFFDSPSDEQAAPWRGGVKAQAPEAA